MKNGNNSASTSTARSNRRETRSQYNDRNRTNDNNNNNSNNVQRGTQFDKRKAQQNSSVHQQQQPQHQYQQQYQSQDRRDRSGQRDSSNQRDRSGNRVGQFPDSSVGRDGYGPSTNLGAVKFNPGYPTRELPPIETKADPSRKFTGRCRLFVGNLPHNTTEEQVRKLFEPFGEIGELYLGPKSSFAFVKMDTKQNAEAARDALDCSNFDGRSLRVRLAAHAAAIRVKHLSPVVTNELLAYSFRYFGEIERAVVVVDDKGKSIGEGIVEYSKKQSALYALKRCQFDCFLLTASPMPVLVEPYDQHDEEEGLPEKSVNKNSIEYKEQRDVGPRFAEVGTFEHSFALKWKELYDVEKQKRERLEKDIEEARKNLQDQIEYSRLEHDTMQLRSKLQKLEDSRLKLQQQKEQSMGMSQQMDDQWRQQSLLTRQQEMGDTSFLGQQETLLRSQAHLLPDTLNGVDPSAATDVIQQDSSQAGLAHEVDSTFGTNQLVGQAPRTFADVAMMGMNQQYMQQQQQQQQQLAAQMSMSNPAAQVMYAGYIPPPTIQGDSLGNSNFASYQQVYVPPPSVSQPSSDAGIRQQKMTRSYVNSNNNINVVARPKKRGRY